MRAAWSTIALFGALFVSHGISGAPAFLTLVSAAAAVLVLLALPRMGLYAYPVSLIGMVFILGYYLVFFLRGVLNSQWMTALFGPKGAQYLSSSATALEAYEITTVAFVVYAVVAGVLALGVGRGSTSELVSDAVARFPVWGAAARRTVISLLAVAVAAAAVVHYVLGAGLGHAPGGQGLGFIYYFRVIALPYALLLVLFHGIKLNSRSTQVAAIVLLVLNGLLQTLLGGSRGAVLWQLVPVVVLLILLGRLRARHVLMLILLVFATGAAWESVSRARSLRRHGNHSIAEAYAAAGQGGHRGSEGSMVVSLAKVPLRVTGLPQLTVTVARVQDQGLGWGRLESLAWGGDRSFGAYYTHEVDWVDTKNLHHGTAPGLLGALYVVGGRTGVAVGTGLWTAVCVLICWLFLRLFTRTGICAVSFLAWWFLVVSSDCVLNMVPLYLGLVLAVCTLGELSVAHLLRRGPA